MKINKQNYTVNMQKIMILLVSITFLMGCKRESVERETYDDDKVKLERTYKTVNGEKELIKEVHFHPNGQKYIEGNYKDNKRDGYWASWYDNGQLWSEGEFKDGLSEGKRTVYHKNGTLYYEGYFKMGERTGTWKFYNEAGELTSETNYDEIIVP
jgi:antitoxin component YwqK of YwqJK toxin-antitoxin module